MAILEAIGIGAAVGSALLGRSASRHEKSAKKHERRLNQLQALRQRKELIRDVQFAQATAMTSSLGAGIGIGSSTIQGQQASQRTTLRDDLGFHDMGGEIGDKIWHHTGRAARTRTLAGAVGAVGQIAGMASAFSGPGEFTNLPEPGTVPAGGTPLFGQVPPPSSRTT